MLNARTPAVRIGQTAHPVRPARPQGDATVSQSAVRPCYTLGNAILFSLSLPCAGVFLCQTRRGYLADAKCANGCGKHRPNRQAVAEWEGTYFRLLLAHLRPMSESFDLAPQTELPRQRSFLRAVVPVLAKVDLVLAIWLAGSLARGQGDRWSSVDLCLLWDEGAPAGSPAVAGQYEAVDVALSRALGDGGYLLDSSGEGCGEAVCGA